jgi:nitrogen fixation/metabolism regulation signal transduction histidine kinase
MSFRGRLFIFFTIIVIVPMAAVAVVLFKITSDSETGKSDSRIAQGLTTALAVYQADVDRAQSALTQVARDPKMSRALATQKQRPIGQRARAIIKARPDIAAISVYDGSGKRITYVRRGPAVAYATAAPTTSKGKRVGTLAVSRTSADDYVRSVKRLTGLDIEVVSDGAKLAASGQAKGRRRFQQVQAAPLPPLSIGVFDEVDSGAVGSSRALIGGILLAFLVLALASSILVVRALQGQVGDFLGAAQRLGQGDFSNPVPVHGNDEFANLGREFNKMSGELETHIAEIQAKRAEL